MNARLVIWKRHTRTLGLASKKKKKALSKKDKQGVAIFFVAAFGLALLGGVPLVLNALSVKYNKVTLCPTEQPYDHTVILIDKTDPLTITQENALRGLVARLRDQMRLYEKLSIFVLDDRNYAFPEPRFAYCNPGNKDDASPIYQNPEMMQIRFEEKFGAPLSAALEDIQLGDTRPSSPIIEMIHSIARLRDFQPSSNSARRLIVVSDMLQNMPSYSHYRTKPDFSKFVQSQYASNMLSDLSDIKVEILYLKWDGSQKRQTLGHGLFWEQFFKHQGAQVLDIGPQR